MNKSDTSTSELLMMKPTEAAQISDLSTRTITRMCKNNEIVAVKLRGVWRINRADFMRKLGLAVNDGE